MSSSSDTSKIESQSEIEKSPDNSTSTPVKTQVSEIAVAVTAPAHSNGYIVAAFLCLLVAFGGFVFGWDTGTISGFVNMPDFIRRFGSLVSSGKYELGETRTGLIVSIFNIGCAVGGITLAKLGDTCGRKKGLTITMMVYIVGIAVQISATKYWVQYFVGRIVSGLAVGSVSVLCPMFISETSPKAIRGTLVSCYQLLITLGILIGYCTCFGTFHNFNDSRQWRIPLGLCFLWALFLIAGMAIMPESPRFLIEKNKIDEAKMSIAKVNGCKPEDAFTIQEVNKLADAINAENNAGSASWKELITGKPKIFYRLMVGVVLQSLQQLSGDNYFFYYGTTIFKSVGLNDSFQTSIILGVVNMLSTFPSLYVVDHFGRRKTLLGGCIGMAVCLVIYASIGFKCLYPGAFGINPVKAVGDSMIFLTCLYIFFFATTWGPTVFVVVSETYPLRIRSKGMGLAQSANWIWGFLIAFFTPAINNAIHFAYGYVFFGCLVFAFVFVFACIPETKGMSLEDVDEVYRHFTPGLAFEKKKKSPAAGDV